MGKYIEIKIREKFLLIFFIIVIFICGGGLYYNWCSYHPEIQVQISEGPTAKERIKIEAPNIALTKKGIAEPATSIELNIQNIIIQHEFLCEYVSNTYKTSNIKLDIKVKEGQTILKYTGVATTLNDELVDFEKEIKCDFELDAKIVH